MNKIRISNLLIFMFILTSCFLLCGCTIRNSDGGLVIYNEKKQQKILNEIIDNLDDLAVIKERYDFKCFFDRGLSGSFEEEFTKYTDKYGSVLFKGEYRDNPEDKNSEPTKLADFLEYYYYDGNKFIVAHFEEGKYEQALSQFKALAAQKADDKVAAYYIKMTEDFFIKGKYPTERDDVGVVYNPDDGVFKLMQK